MLKKIIALMFVIVLAMTMCGASFAEESTYDRIVKRGKLIVATSPGYFPFEMADKKGNFIGYDIDIAKYLAKEMKVQLEVTPYEWEGIIPALTGGKADLLISGMNITDKRKKVVSFSDPYFKTGLGLLVNNKHKIKSWADVDKKGMKIGVMIGDASDFFAQKFFKNATVTQMANGSEGLAIAVAQGKLDACVHDTPWCVVYAKKNPKGLYAFVADNGTEEPMGIAFQKDDKKMEKFLNDALAKLKKDKQYKEMYKYWFVDMPWMKDTK